ncbi:hypothetical protein [Chondromyces apiculatus]|nr:hypothetical protein [Chondromyces apiculatus]
MRRTRWANRTVAFLMVAAGAQVMGCWPLDFSEDDQGTGGGGTGGAGGAEPPACPGDPVADPSLVRDGCGIFVSASAAPGGDGTKARPLQSFGEAVAVAATASNVPRIYACAESYAETAAVTFDRGVEIFGGFTDCGATGAWRWDDSQRATLNGAADQVALTLDGGSNVLRNLNVTAASAVAAGGSSIAVVVRGGSLELSAGDLTAQDAKDGEAGSSLPSDPGLDGDGGEPGLGVCMSAADNPGPAGKTKTCSGGETTVGGDGGDGGVLLGGVPQAAGDGTAGMPAPSAGEDGGEAGVGEVMSGSPACTAGNPGSEGGVGTSGGGAQGAGLVSVAGYQGAAGSPGVAGRRGQGGGGGGGARGAQNITCNGTAATRVGATGGAGGTGGCGGAGGAGGQAGGSSIALVVLDATVTLTDVVLVAARAGNGGDGGDGQDGGAGGLGGARGAGTGNAKPGCLGGDGGPGGAGGPGGGGQGGHSLGIALQGGSAPVGGSFTIEPTNAGTGGLGGTNNTAEGGGQGASGAAANCWDLAANAACSG